MKRNSSERTKAGLSYESKAYVKKDSERRFKILSHVGEAEFPIFKKY